MEAGTSALLAYSLPSESSGKLSFRDSSIEWGVQVSLVVSDSLRPHELQHARPPCPSPTPGVYTLSQWWYPTISSSVIPFSSCPQSFPASGSFPKLEWIAIPFPRGSSQPRDQTQVSKWQAYLYHLSHQGKTYIHLVSVKFSLWLPEDVRYNQTKCLSFLFKDERRETERLTSETCLKFGDSKVRGSEKDMDQKYYW